MKKQLIFLSGFILISFLLGDLFAQGKTHEQDIRTVFNKIIRFSHERNYKDAYKLITIDQSENTDTPKHEQKVRRICNQVYALLQLSDYSVSDYNATFDDGITHYNLIVKFVSGEQEIEKRFQFIENNDLYLLDRVD